MSSVSKLFVQAVPGTNEQTDLKRPFREATPEKTFSERFLITSGPSESGTNSLFPKPQIQSVLPLYLDSTSVKTSDTHSPRAFKSNVSELSKPV